MTIYADYQATTPVDSRVLDAMAPYWDEAFGNPHSVDHTMGWYADEAVGRAAAAVGALIGADAAEITFTSGATEANNLALSGLARRAPPTRRRILVSAIEHKSILAVAEALAAREGFLIEVVPVDSVGRLRVEVLRKMLDETVLVISVMAVNNEVGTVQEISNVATLVRRSGALLHCDAAQAPCAVDVRDLAAHADLISLSGHKIYGPKGIGALYVRHGLADRLEPLLYGGGQQGGLRSGTSPVPLCVGMGAAASILVEEGEAERKRVAGHRNTFLRELHDAFGAVALNGPPAAQRHPGNANLRFEGCDAQDLLGALQPDLAASTGAACTSGITEPSYVLRAMGLGAADAASSVRFSFGRFTSDAEVRRAGDLVVRALQSLGATADTFAQLRN